MATSCSRLCSLTSSHCYAGAACIRLLPPPSTAGRHRGCVCVMIELGTGSLPPSFRSPVGLGPTLRAHIPPHRPACLLFAVSSHHRTLRPPTVFDRAARGLNTWRNYHLRITLPRRRSASSSHFVPFACPFGQRRERALEFSPRALPSRRFLMPFFSVLKPSNRVTVLLVRHLFHFRQNQKIVALW